MLQSHQSPNNRPIDPESHSRFGLSPPPLKAHASVPIRAPSYKIGFRPAGNAAPEQAVSKVAPNRPSMLHRAQSSSRMLKSEQPLTSSPVRPEDERVDATDILHQLDTISTQLALLPLEDVLPEPQGSRAASEYSSPNRSPQYTMATPLCVFLPFAAAVVALLVYVARLPSSTCDIMLADSDVPIVSYSIAMATGMPRKVICGLRRMVRSCITQNVVHGTASRIGMSSFAKVLIPAAGSTDLDLDADADLSECYPLDVLGMLHIAGSLVLLVLVSGWCAWYIWCWVEPHRAYACLWRSLFRIGRGQLPVPALLYASSQTHGRCYDTHGTGGKFRPITTHDVWQRLGDNRVSRLPHASSNASFWLFGALDATASGLDAAGRTQFHGNIQSLNRIMLSVTGPAGNAPSVLPLIRARSEQVGRLIENGDKVHAKNKL